MLQEAIQQADQANPFLRTKLGVYEGLSLLEIEKKRAEGINQTVGTLSGYDCKECLNRGYFAAINEEGCRISWECRCMRTRKSIRLIEKSGLSNLLQRYTFETWRTEVYWQKQALQTAKAFAQSRGNDWLLMSGRPGSGKTHLCTAICGDMMKRGVEVRYLLWRDFSVMAKSVVNDQEEYQHLVEPMKRVPVLYIDDFFKAGRDDRGNMKITPGDINLAFEILNARYNDQKLRTILSSEYMLGDLLKLDEGVGSRIRERTKEFYIALNLAENWRMR